MAIEKTWHQETEALYTCQMAPRHGICTQGTIVYIQHFFVLI